MPPQQAQQAATQQQINAGTTCIPPFATAASLLQPKQFTRHFLDLSTLVLLPVIKSNFLTGRAAFLAEPNNIPVLASMDDIQFNASLDALLANETLEGTSGDGDTSIDVPSLRASTAASYGNGTAASNNGVSAGEGSTAFPANNLLQGSYTTAPVQYSTTATNPATGQDAATAAGTVVPHQLMPPSSGPSSMAKRGSFASQGSYDTGSANERAGSKTCMSGTKRARGGDKDATAVSEDEDDKGKRRHDRNLREQQRSHKITAQIDHLRSILSLAQIPHKPDKYSTLVTVFDYIKQLQQRSALLDAEHKKLIDTISRTNEIANEPHLPESTTSSNGTLSRRNGSGLEAVSSISGRSGSGISHYNEEELVFVRNVDYKSIFFRCGVPLAVATIDGRFLDCNVAFENVSGYKREEMIPHDQPTSRDTPDAVASLSSNDGHNSLLGLDVSTNAQKGSVSDMTSEATDGHKSDAHSATKSLSLFNLLSRECMESVFLALSAMLKRPSKKDSPQTEIEAETNDVWTGNVRLNRNTEIEVCSMDVQLTSIFVESSSHQFHPLLLSDENACCTSPLSRRTSQVLQLLPFTAFPDFRLSFLCPERNR
jgi:PAS domain-containing protein